MSNATYETPAHEAFVQNIARMYALQELLGENFTKALTALRLRQKHLRSKIVAALLGGNEELSKDEDSEEADRKERSARLELSSALVFEWELVMLVTFAEAYLEDVLAACAARDPGLMSASEQAVSYQQVRGATSLEELADEIRHRWARNFVDDGGPTRWIDRLTRMGARGYESNDSSALEELWGLRHVVVHAAGRITRDFARRHPRLGYDVGARLDIDTTIIPDYDDALFRFVDTTDAFLVRRYFSGASGND